MLLHVCLLSLFSFEIFSFELEGTEMGKLVKPAEGKRKGSLFACLHACLLSRAQLFVTLWTVACQVSLSMGFFRQEYWDPGPGTTCLWVPVGAQDLRQSPVPGRRGSASGKTDLLT